MIGFVREADGSKVQNNNIEMGGISPWVDRVQFSYFQHAARGGRSFFGAGLEAPAHSSPAYEVIACPKSILRSKDQFTKCFSSFGFYRLLFFEMDNGTRLRIFSLIKLHAQEFPWVAL